MSIEIEKCDHCGLHHLYVNGATISTAGDRGIVEREARILEHCRNIPYRAAIKCLMEDIGFGEENAKLMYIKLTEHRNTGAVN